ncbi:PAS domain S-box protein [Piscinibacter gummiphilus]|uniref:histidine kinase n=1 Tax=Piscinibacter gummiphilus TaxID=946333 RepID=A0ABZ0CZ81_9BURK|nr:PAS domain S-box protein [Piscinibacter gummiphilus]WOB08471.1 PAS domain S-box protein [Piscinibacter gummiphilus]
MSEPPVSPHDLAAIIGRVQSRYIRAAPPREVFEPLLIDLLDCTGSEYGFIADVLHDEHGAPFLRMEVLTDISWNDATRAMVERHLRGGEGDALEFHNLGTLFGHAVRTGEVVVSNQPGSDPRRGGGLPAGHPPMRAFLGVPLFHGGEMVGQLGLANRHGGYDQALVDRLQPLFTSVAAIMGAVRAERARRAAEQALREQRAQLQATVDLAGVGIVELSLDGTPRMINQRMCDMLGRTREAQMKLRTDQVTHPDDLPAEQTLRARLLAGEVPRYHCTKRYLHAEGHAVWVNANTSLVRKPDGSPDYLIVVAEDITERMQADAALRSSQQRFLDLVNSVDGIFWEADLEERRFTYVSDKAEAITGFAPARWMERAFWATRVHPEDRDRAVSEIIAVQLAGTPQSIEYRFIAADGRVLWMSSLVTVLQSEDGRRLLRGLIIDATALKQAEESQLAAQAALRANAAKTQFLSRMSHELRTPLNAVLGFAQLLALDTAHPLTPAQRARVDHISQAGSHLLAMINDVLDLSRIESGGVSLMPAVVPVYVVVSEAISLVVNAAAQAGVTITVDRSARDLAAPTTCVRADHLRLRQVLVNLLSNAIKYNRSGGTVILRWPVAPDGQVLLQVQDSGIGLSAAQQEHLFEPFNRLGIERSGIEGTGIGLVITQRLLQVMGGRLSVESTLGVGSCFTASLPEAQPASALPVQAQA